MKNDHGNHDGHGHRPVEHRHAAPGAEPGVTRDPVCGMTVDPEGDKPAAEFGGHTYHFCSASCRGKFVMDPEAYLQATDPVCGMNVDRATARHFTRRDGQGFYFCSPGCQRKFEGDPGSFLGARPAIEAMAAGTQYTCPMHPEIIRDKPGSCDPAPLNGSTLSYGFDHEGGPR